MMTIYRWENGGLKETPDFAPSCWINLTEPSTTELEAVLSHYGVPRDFLTDPLDAGERPRFDWDDDSSIIIVHVPMQLPQPVPVVKRNSETPAPETMSMEPTRRESTGRLPALSQRGQAKAKVKQMMQRGVPIHKVARSAHGPSAMARHPVVLPTKASMMQRSAMNLWLLY